MRKSMRRTALILSLVFLFAVIPLYPAEANTDSYSQMRVRLSLGEVTTLDFILKGSYTIAGTDIIVENCTVTVSLVETAVKVFYGENCLYSGAECTFIKNNPLPEAGYCTLPNERSYLGNFRVLIHEEYLRVINIVPLAYYLYGVVGGEMSNDLYPLEALKSQAIVAKCYALLRLNPSADYDIGDTSSDQVYKGYAASHTKVIQAVNESLKYVLTYEDSIIRTYYSASNGGETVLPSQRWGGSTTADMGYAVSLDEYDIANPNSRNEVYTITYGPLQENTESLVLLLMDKIEENEGARPSAIVTISSIKMVTPRFAGSVRDFTECSFTVTASMPSGDETVTDIEYTLLFDTYDLMTYNVFVDKSLRSFWGESTADGTGYSIYHVRWGHGVGLSQRGAQQRARDGHTMEQILAFYYPTAVLSTINVSLPTEPGTPTPTPSATPYYGDYVVTASVSPTIPTATPASISENKTDAASPPAWVPQNESNAVAYGVVTASIVNVRTGPSLNNPIVTRVERNDTLNILGTYNNWYLIVCDTASGYIMSDYVEVTGYPQAPTLEIPYTNATINADNVNFREAPTTSSASIRRLSLGTEIYVWNAVAGTDKDWCYVQIGLTYGYVHSPYVTLGTTGVYVGGSLPDYIAMGNTTSNVNLRTEPSTNTSVITTLPRGTSFFVIEVHGEWFEVISGTYKGFLMSSYVSIINSVPLPPDDMLPDETDPVPPETGGTSPQSTAIGTASVIIDGSAMHSKPSGESDVLVTLLYGTQVCVYTHSNGWYEVSYVNLHGYITADCLQFHGYTTSPTSGAILAEGITTARINFRQYPSLTADVLAILNDGTSVDIIGKCEEWYFVMVDSTTGYLVNDWVATFSDGDSQLITVNSQWQSAPAVTTDIVNLRFGASYSYAVICEIPANTEVRLLACSNSWALIKHNGIFGFLSMNYIEL